MSKLALVLFVVFFGFFVRLWNLDGLPAEMWGDVIEGYKLTSRISSGNPFITYEFGGDGPMFFYLTSLLFTLFGPSFLLLKIASAVIGTVLIGATFELGRQYRGFGVGLTAATLMAVSKWSVIYSRMAKPHILSALFAVLCFIFLFKFLKRNNLFHAFTASVFLGLGMYTQSAFWGMPFVVLVVWVIHFLKSSQKLHMFYKPAFWLSIPALLIVFPLIMSPLVLGGDLFRPNSFFGEKMLIRSSRPVLDVPISVARNFYSNLKMFNLTGSTIVRDNSSPASPVLDFLSGSLFILGILTSFRLRQPYLLLFPFILLQIPSLLDLNNSSLPNFGRTIVIMPWTYLIVALGMNYWFFLDKSKIRASVVTTSVVLIISISNLGQYFNIYPKHLPNSNIPFGRIIATKIDLIPNQFDAVIAGCCWGQGDDPHPHGIQIALKVPRILHLVNADPTICKGRGSSKPTYYVVDPRYYLLLQESCPHLVPNEDIVAGQYLIAKTFTSP